ncbi:MAG: sensor histidine kinase [Nitrososphaera sp.]|uniref:sensor histidine kinase n=1 Tax=Nitrososphaera sp. TaxID=1971748 RepID=UPI003D6F6C30
MIIAIVASLSAISSSYSASTSEQIEKIAVQETRSNAEIQAHHLSNSLANKLADVTNNLQIISKAPAVQENDFERAKKIFNNAETASSDIADFYMWLDREGRIVWISNINQTAYDQYRGFDLSYRSYFMHSRDTLQTYYSSVTDSNDRVLRLYISYPILDEKLQQGTGGKANDGAFMGVVVAGVRTEVLGKFLEGEISPKLEGQVGLLDNRGIILYSKDTPYLGKNVFGVRFQSFLSSLDAESVDSFNSGFKAALQGETGSRDTTMNNSRVTFAYQPVTLEEKQFGALYILAPHGQASAAAALIDQQRNLTTLTILAMAAAALGILFLIFSWNKRLEQTVSARTAELREANLQLEARDKMQQEFINVAAHELRTPVLPIILGAEDLAETLPDNSIVQIILRNARRITKLTNDILDASRIESNSLRIDKKRFNLKDLIADVIDDYGKQVSSDSREIEYEVQDMEVEADATRITQVLSNLLGNSLKFTKKGRITITARKDGSQVVVAVRDTGTGIDPDIIPRLFTKFSTKSDSGTGLGLFISKSIVEAHGGRIWAENNPDGKGATFAFSLPA